MTETLRFKYQKSPFLTSIGVFVCFLGAAYCFPASETHSETYVTKFGYEMTVEQTRMALYAIGVGSVLLGLYTFLALLRSVVTKQEVVLSSTNVSMPKSRLSKKTAVVEYSDIRKIKERSAQGAKFLEIHHSGGVMKIVRQMCSKRREFKQIAEVLNERMISS